MARYHSDGSPKPPRTPWILGVILAVVFIGLIALASSCATVDQDKVGFAVGGGPFDPHRHQVKGDLLTPGLHITGTLDGKWTYPAYKTLRFQDFETTVTTVDSRRVVVKGQVGFRFVGEHDPALAKEFATGIGSRKWGGERPGESDSGWENFLDQLVSPVINSTLKDGFGKVYCADFEPQCRSIDPRTNVPDTNPEAVYSAISRNLSDRIAAALGSPEHPKQYLQDISLRIASVDVPAEVRRNIDQVTTEQAKTKAAEQAEITAHAEANAINTRGKALRANQDQIPLEIAKQCKGGQNCTIIVDASGNGVKTSVNAGR